MPAGIMRYERKKEFLICIDSDGCAMDTMNSKHMNCFGPCLISIWGLEDWREPVLRRWNEINLYTMTRGINRFKGLAVLLKEVDQNDKKIPGLERFEAWAGEAKELSNDSVKEMWEKTKLEVFAKALEWSVEVNRKIAGMPDSRKSAFPGVLAGVKAAHRLADVAVVSSANGKAVQEEWEKEGLLPFVDVILSQENGTKSDGIRKLLSTGYKQEKCLMVGDALGDFRAAEENGIFYYPILVNQEQSSWEQLVLEALGRLEEGTYGGDYQNQLIQKFQENLR